MKKEEEYDDFESWEGDYWLLEKKQYGDLIKLRKRRAEKYKDDLNAQIALGEAYVLGQEFQSAFEHLEKLHRAYPDISSISHLIIEALRGLGKTEGDFNWIIKPEITVLNEALFQKCLVLLKKKRKKRRTIFDLYSDLTIEDTFLDFTQNELENWLQKDSRIEIIDDKSKMFPLIEIKRK